MHIINTYRGIRDSRVFTQTPAIKIIKGFKTESRMTRTIIHARTFRKGHSSYEELKHRQHTWSPNATFSGSRCANNLLTLSGLVYFDVDELPQDETLEELKRRLHQNPSVFAVWLSFGGRGLGGVLRCDLIDSKHVYYVTGQFATSMQITIDAKVRHVAAQSVFTYDPEILINENAVPFEYDTESADALFNQKQQSINISLLNPQGKWWEAKQTDRIVFKTRLEPCEYSSNDYVLKPEGQRYCEVYIPKGGISAGQRNARLITICNKIIANSPKAEKIDLEAVMQTINQKYCHPNLDAEEVSGIVEWCWENKLKDKLMVAFENRKIWIDPYKSLSTQQKRAIVGKATGELSRMKMGKRVAEEIQKLQLNGYDISKAELRKSLGISERHIHRIWKQYRDLIEGMIQPSQKGLTDDADSKNYGNVLPKVSEELVNSSPAIPENLLIVNMEMQAQIDDILRFIESKIAEGNLEFTPISCQWEYSQDALGEEEVVQIIKVDGTIKYVTTDALKMVLSTFKTKPKA